MLSMNYTRNFSFEGREEVVDYAMCSKIDDAFNQWKW